MLKYKNFLDNKVLESINESVMYFTKDFEKKISSFKNNEIAKELLKFNGVDVKPDMTLIDLSDKDDYITFSQMKNAVNYLKKTYIDKAVSEFEKGILSYNHTMIILNDKGLFDKSRNEAKIGKLIKQIFPKRFSDKEVEEFVNLYKSSFKKGDFELVSGGQIGFWYNKENYLEVSGDLGNSCMRGGKCSKFFKIYEENSNCRLLILKKQNEDGDFKILGRALVWRVNTIIDEEEVEYFMDRVYGIDAAVSTLFREYAISQNWLIRYTNIYSDYKHFLYKNKELKNFNMTVVLEKSKFDYYPYMDTFKKVNIDESILYNSEDNQSNSYILTETDGSFIVCPEGVWSDFAGELIDEDYAVYSEYAMSFLDSRNSVEVVLGVGQGWYPIDCDDVVFDSFRGKYINIESTTFSDYYYSSIYIHDLEHGFESIFENEISVVECSKLDLNFIPINELRSKSYPGYDCVKFLRQEIGCERISKKFTKPGTFGLILPVSLNVYKVDINGNWSFKDLYFEGLTKYPFLSQVDANTLGMEIDMKSPILIDVITYYYNFDEVLLKKIKNLCKDGCDDKSSIINIEPQVTSYTRS